MKSAYLYIRVSTDEQKRKGYSLPEQEDRLLKYCEFQNIEVKAIFREDFSAKDFNRPEWKKLVSTIRKSRSKESNTILFLNTLLYKTKFVNERRTLLRQLEEQEHLKSKARKLFVDDQLKFDDFRELKKEYQDISDVLKKEFNVVINKLKHIDLQIAQVRSAIEDVFQVYQFMDPADKKQIVNLIPPAEVNIQTGDVSIQMNSALAKILCHK
jgi:hypothetical protein